jgi:hypothetical protein
MSARRELHGLHRQTGAVGLLAALFLIMAVLVMGQSLLRQSASGAGDSLLAHDAVTALFLAESGLERAAADLAAGTATCDASLTAGSPLSYAGGTIAIADLGAGFATDFDGSALGTGRCRVRATGTTGLFAAQRTVEAIIDTEGNLLGGANANFDLPNTACDPSNCQPTGWSFVDQNGNPPTLANPAWDDFGGTGGTRSAYVRKQDPGNEEVTSAGQYALTPFTITAPATLTMTFDYKYLCDQSQDMRIEMELSSGGTTYAMDGTFVRNLSSPNYQAGVITFTIPGSGPVVIDGFGFTLIARPGRPKQIWLDNLFLAGGGAGDASLVRWREIIN